MKISIDIDGVLANFTEGVKKIANAKWPGKMAPDYAGPYDWNYADVFTKEEWSFVWAAIKTDPVYWESLVIYKDNVTALSKFLVSNPEHEVYYITSRIPTGGVSPKIQTTKWLYQHGLLNKNTTLLVVSKPEYKRGLLESLEIEKSVDDYGPTVEQNKTLPNHLAYLLDRPWNKDKDYGPRVYSVSQFLEGCAV